MTTPQASSRLEMLQARFQQKQLQEKEQKLLQLYDQQQQRAYQVVQRGSAGSNSSNHSSTTIKTSTTTTSTSQGGKVRQMFDERRQTTVKGIDRSYPLEPLENKLRKQTNGVATQRNGNLTVNRQSVNVRRVARADVNSNVNNGKPVVSYHEEITRESFEPPTYRYNDEDEYGLVENRVANGHYRHDADYEEKIALDQETIERNRLMAKIHLMGFDETLKHRVRNDLESEEFPEYLMADMSDKLPKKNATKKLTQAEARLERFRNANAKRNDVPKQSTSNKRSKQTVPPRSNSRWCEITGTSLTSASGRSSERNRTILENYADYLLLVAKTRATNEMSKEQRKSYIERQRDTLPKLFTNATKTQTNWNISPRNNEFKSVTADGRIFIRRSPSSPQFYCRETERSATTTSIDRRSSSSESLFYRNTSRSATPQYFDRRIGTSLDRKTANSSKSDEEKILNNRSNKPQFFCKESERSATTMLIEPKSSPSISYARESYTPSRVKREVKKDLNKSSTSRAVVEAYRSPNLSSATSASSLVSLKYGLEFDNILQSAKPVRKFTRSPNGKICRLPLKRNINNINTPRDNLSKNRYKTLSLSREVKSPSIESGKRTTFEIPRKSITPTEVDRETQEITMTDHRIEYDKVRKTPTPLSKRQIDEIYTKSPSNKIKSKLCLTYPVNKTRKQRASVLESNVFKPAKASIFGENKISKYDSEGSAISLSKLDYSSKSGSSQRTITPIRLYSSFAEKNKNKIPETREQTWTKTIRNQSEQRKNRQSVDTRYQIRNQFTGSKARSLKVKPYNSLKKRTDAAVDGINAEIDVNYQTIVSNASNRRIKDQRKINCSNLNDSAANKDVFFRLTTREPLTKFGASKKIISPTKVCSRQHCTKSSISPRNSLRKIAEISRSADISKALLSGRIASKANQSFTLKSPNKTSVQHKIGKEIRSPSRLTKTENLTENQQRSTRSSVCKRLFESDSETKIPKERSNLSSIEARNKEYSCSNLKSCDNKTVLQVSFFKNFDNKISKKSKNSEEITVKPLRSVKEIRKSIDNKQNKLIVAKKSRPVIANWRSVSPENVDVILKNPQNPTRLTKVTSRVSRITKSPSPDSAATKQLKTNTRENAPASPSKNYDTTLKRASANSKNQDAKPSRKSAKDADSNGNKATTAEEIDTTDGVVIQNDSLYESTTKSPDVLANNDDQPSKESNTISSKRPSIKKSFTDKQQTASNASDRPNSSVSSNSSANSTQGQISNTKSKMTTRTKTSADANLVACNICGRSFARDRISYHEQICTKTTNKKRKKFDTTMFRVKGTELEPFVKKGLSKKQETTKKPEVKSNWRRKHEDFINTIRSAKQYQAAVAKGINPADLPPPPPSDTSDYIQCPHCGRKFNEAAAERHISKCKNMLHNKPMHMRAKLRR